MRTNVYLVLVLAIILFGWKLGVGAKAQVEQAESQRISRLEAALADME